MGLNETPRGGRIHIALYGRRNSGKSSLINALTGQKIALVSDVAGTTADPVYKPIELRGIGACALIDTAGFDDEGALGALRVEKTRETLDRADLALLVLSTEALADAAAPAALPSAETSASGTPQVDIPVRREAPAAPGMAGTQDTKEMCIRDRDNTAAVLSGPKKPLTPCSSCAARTLPQWGESRTTSGKEPLLRKMLCYHFQSPVFRTYSAEINPSSRTATSRFIAYLITLIQDTT